MSYAMSEQDDGTIDIVEQKTALEFLKLTRR